MCELYLRLYVAILHGFPKNTYKTTKRIPNRLGGTHADVNILSLEGYEYAPAKTNDKQVAIRTPTGCTFVRVGLFQMSW